MKSKWVRAAGALVLLPMGVWFIIALLYAAPAVQSGILAIVGVVTVGIIANTSAKKREIEARHFNEKREGYTAFVDMMMESLLAEKSGRKPPTKRELLDILMKYKKMLLIWADADVIKMWNKVEMMGINNTDGKAALMVWDELLRVMRKDLGKDDSQLAKGELISLILRDEAKDKVKQGSI